MQYIRTNIYLTATQKAALRQGAEAQGLKSAELIRRIVDAYLAKEQRHGR